LVTTTIRFTNALPPRTEEIGQPPSIRLISEIGVTGGARPVHHQAMGVKLRGHISQVMGGSNNYFAVQGILDVIGRRSLRTLDTIASVRKRSAPRKRQGPVSLSSMQLLPQPRVGLCERTPDEHRISLGEFGTGPASFPLRTKRVPMDFLNHHEELKRLALELEIKAS
jgi:hypothetical protein